MSMPFISSYPIDTLIIFTQILLLIVIPLIGPLFPLSIPGLFIITASVVVGLWAFFEMGRHTPITIHPSPPPKATFITTGPYRYIRNPMYSALIIAFITLTLEHPTPQRSVATIALTLLLVIKVIREESYLEKKFPDYPTYKKNTKRFIPGMW